MGEAFGELIRRLRKERHLGLRDTAEKVGITAGYLSRIEKGVEQYPPREEIIRQLAELLEQDFDLLMQLAGRVSGEMKDLFGDDPKLPEFLRAAREQKLTGEDLLKMLKRKRKKEDR